MSVREPRPGCYELGFQHAYPIDETGEVALEDYARALTRAPAAEAVRKPDDPAVVKGVHICGLGISLTQALLDDLEDFARALTPPRASGLGWS
jgi:hypothetical protein